MTKEDFIRQTFELAKKGQGMTSPNPMVGAVIVKDGRILSTGYHHAYGLDHAELDAIKNAKESLEGATIYVNLEPCCHTKKQTPPCAQRLIAEKFKKVVISNLDPNPAVNGEGVKLLREAGILVEHGTLEQEGEEINEAFFLAQRLKRPFIHLKSATTLDGKIALPSGESQWITGPEARTMVHEMRSIHQGVIVGAETVRKDNPKLNVRLPDYTGKHPYRIVFTQSGKLPSDAHLFNDELKHQTIIITMSPLSFDFPSEQVLEVKTLKEALEKLFEKKFIHLFMEGGATLASAFMKEGLIDRVSVFVNPSFLGEGKPMLESLGLKKLADRPGLKNIRTQLVGGDILISGRLT